jgi:TolB protein
MKTCQLFERRDAIRLLCVALLPALIAGRCDPSEPIGVEGASWLPDGRVLLIRDGGGPSAALSDKAYVMDADGRNVVPLANDLANVRALLPSPDGRHVAVTTKDDEHSELYIVTMRGGAVTHIGAGSGPAWSPDGRQLAFLRDELIADTWRSYAYVSDAAGTRVRRLLEGFEVRWAPGRQQLAVRARRDSVSTVSVLASSGAPAGTTAVRHGSADTGAWSPDGRWLAYVRGRSASMELRVADLAHGGALRARVALHDVEQLSGVVWSPDSRRLTVTGVEHGQGIAYAIGVADGDRVLLQRAGLEIEDPVWSPDGRRVAFAVVGPHSASLVVVRGDGTGSEVVTRTCDGRPSPAWSPDGRTLLFRDTCVGGKELYVAQVASHAITRLTWGAWTNTEQAWSPDGERLAFTRRGDDDSATVYMTGLHGDSVTPVVRGEQPTWSPDGARLAVVTHADDRSIVRIVDADGRSGRAPATSPRWSVDSADAPAWAPDGTRLAVVAQWNGMRSIRILELRDGTTRPLLTSSARAGGSTTADVPAWSPDGSRVAFVMKTPGARDGIYVAPAAGGEPVRISEACKDASSPTWSPDGHRIAFLLRFDEGNRELWLANADGTDARRLSRWGAWVATPAWSPDGRQIAFTRLAKDGIHVFLVDVADDTERRLSDDPALQWGPVWSSDGRWISLVSERGGNANLWIVHPDGTGLRPLTHPPAQKRGAVGSAGVAAKR